jgi:hypothetical protein
MESVLDLEEYLTRVDADERQDAHDDHDGDCGHHRVFGDVLAGVVRDCILQKATHTGMGFVSPDKKGLSRLGAIATWGGSHLECRNAWIRPPASSFGLVQTA